METGMILMVELLVDLVVEVDITKLLLDFWDMAMAQLVKDILVDLVS